MKLKQQQQKNSYCDKIRSLHFCIREILSRERCYRIYKIEFKLSIQLYNYTAYQWIYCSVSCCSKNITLCIYWQKLNFDLFSSIWFLYFLAKKKLICQKILTTILDNFDNVNFLRIGNYCKCIFKFSIQLNYVYYD